MHDDNVISFEKHRQKKGKSSASRSEETFNPYRSFLHELFRGNHEIHHSRNPDAGFLIGFSKKSLDNAERFVRKELTNLNRKHVVVDAGKKTFREICKEITGTDIALSYDAFRGLEQILLQTDTIIVIREFSHAKVRFSKTGMLRSLVKVIDDAHLDGIYPLSDLIFIDYADFLQKAWEEIGSYVRIGTAR